MGRGTGAVGSDMNTAQASVAGEHEVEEPMETIRSDDEEASTSSESSEPEVYHCEVGVPGVLLMPSRAPKSVMGS